MVLNESQRAELRRTLATLHAQLNEADDVSDETCELLRSAAADIDRVLESEQEGLTEEMDPAAESWREAVFRFEGRHPTLTQIIDQITTALANLGI